MRKILFLLLLARGMNWGAEMDNYYYRGLDYGSQLTVTPVNILLNGGYDMLQTKTASNKIFTLNYSQGARNVWSNMTNPLGNIDRYGWGEFFGNEIAPKNPNVEDAQWVPNYTLHMIGGGLTYRTLAEWYSYRGFNYPRTMALANVYAYHIWNEIVENGETIGPNVDAIADLWIFNPLGILMFNHEPTARFFSKTLHAANWSTMPSIDPGNNTLENVSLNFSFKYYPPFSKKLGLFYFTGMNSVLGLTQKLPGDHNISGGFGIGTVGIVDVDQANGHRKVTAVLGWTVGTFWDKQNSLLASLIVSQQRLYRIRLNIYPNPNMQVFGLKPGFFVATGQEGEKYLGFSVYGFPFGISSSFRL